MRKPRKFIVLTILTAAAALLAFVLCMSGADSAESSKTEKQSARLAHSPTNTRRSSSNVKRRPLPSARTSSTKIAPKPKPVLNTSDSEFAELDDLQKEILMEIQAAIDAGEFQALRTAVEKMIAMGRRMAEKHHGKDWSAHVPALMKRNAVEALGWFGSQALPEIIGFLGDSDPETAQDAQMRLEEALQDYELSDYMLAEVLVQLMRVTTDADTIDSYYMELSRMRNSVMISTLVEIGQSGTSAAQEKLAENISFYTGDFEIETVEQAEQWLKDNPDGEDDDEFYGGEKPSGDTSFQFSRSE